MLSHFDLINLITCAQERASQALQADDFARVRSEGETVAHWADRLADHWSLYKRGA